jgi:hypothetical protein
MQKSVACAVDAQIAKLAIYMQIDLAGLLAEHLPIGTGIP